MRKNLIYAVALATALVPAGAAAAKPAKKDKKTKPAYCVPKKRGYNAKGTLVSHAVTQTQGEDTKKRGDDRYSGNVTVDVTKVNHRGMKGEQTFTFENIRVKFHPRKDTEPAAGDRVKLKGKVVKAGKKCTTSDPVVTLKKVDIKAKRAKRS